MQAGELIDEIRLARCLCSKSEVHLEAPAAAYFLTPCKRDTGLLFKLKTLPSARANDVGRVWL